MHPLRLNGFTGAPPRDSSLSPSAAKAWIGVEIPSAAQLLGPRRLADFSKWEDPEVGWGLVLPDDHALSNAQKATADDAPKPVRRLLAHRSGVVLRWSPELPATKLRRYYPDGTVHDPHVVMAARGTAAGRIPRYLLLYGPPDSLPWTVQYTLSAVAFVGRLDLEGQALSNYVDAAISGWDGAAALATRAVTWAVDHGGRDITGLMRRVIAQKLHEAYAEDPDMEAYFVDGSAESATAARLLSELQARVPGVILTTSHGMTGPLNDVAAMREHLGVPVDDDFAPLSVSDVLSRWSPDGAVWYAHACCSAGADGLSAYEGLVESGSEADEILRGVAACGPLVAPLPRMLLGAERPLRAFIGHVEPTFDWTLKDPSTGQVLTTALVEALYRRLFQPRPIGYAFEEVHQQAPRLELMRQSAKRRATHGKTPEERQGGLEEALTCRLVAQDLQSLVILGDPAEVPRL